MELLPNKYYNTGRFPNTQYIMMMAIEEYFGMEIFKGDSSRVFYASPEYTFRRRLDMLNANAAQDIHSIDVPFMSYYRKTNWIVDRARKGIESPGVALAGITTEDGLPIRFMNTSASFTLYMIFGRDDEAQIAYETLLWMKHPSAKSFTQPGLAYKDHRLDLPVQLWIDNVTFNPQFKETDWLKKNRMITIQADFSMKSVIIAPIAQGSKSTLFETTTEPYSSFYITKEAYLDYFSSKNYPLPDEAHMELAIIGEFNNDPTLGAIVNKTAVTSDSFTITWDYNSEAATYFETKVKITTNTGLEVEVDRDAKTYTFTGLQPNSVYSVTLWFYSTQDYINKYDIIVTTAAGDFKPLSLKTVQGR